MFPASIMTTLTEPLLWLLRHVHALGFTWAWSIIVLTFIVRSALVPLTVKQQQSMRRMTALQPELKKLQQKYKHDRQLLNEKMMEFYRENNTNPFGSCLPIVVQIPIFIGLFYLLRRPERFVQPGDDLSFFVGIRDITEHLNQLPTATLAVLMIIYVSSQVGSMLLMPSTADPRYKYLFAGMPILFAVFIVNQAFPVGLMLYWITTNLWTVGQAAVIRKWYPPPAFVEQQKARAAASGKKGDEPPATPAKRTEPKPKPSAPAAQQQPEPKPKPKPSAQQPPRSPAKGQRRVRRPPKPRPGGQNE
jgi:YidC/Oxa1 family membrane protein insertase